MNLGDFLVCFIVSIAASVATLMGWYWVALFNVLFFLLLLANICLLHMQLPLPRYMVGIEVELDEDEDDAQDGS